MMPVKLLSVLLDYPAEELWQHGGELLVAAQTAELAPERQAQLAGFVSGLLDSDPLEAQERWLALFDRGRSMSLLLFEHIHGESRDRGQAMVDLMRAYRDGGLEITKRELPDYLPLVLEYLSQRPREEIVDWLSHASPILELLAARAQERGSPYALLFEVLVEAGRGEVDLTAAMRRVSGESPDHTPEAMDRVWEEELVRFGAETPAGGCPPPREAAGARHESGIQR